MFTLNIYSACWFVHDSTRKYAVAALHWMHPADDLLTCPQQADILGFKWNISSTIWWTVVRFCPNIVFPYFGLRSSFIFHYLISTDTFRGKSGPSEWEMDRRLPVWKRAAAPATFVHICFTKQQRSAHMFLDIFRGTGYLCASSWLEVIVAPCSSQSNHYANHPLSLLRSSRTLRQVRSRYGLVRGSSEAIRVGHTAAAV